MKFKKPLAIALSAVLAAGLLAGCGSSSDTSAATSSDSSSSSASTESGEAKVLTFGCQMYSDGLIDPVAQTNCAWNCMRYGISECLFKFDDNMQPGPWLADSYEVNDDYTEWVITLKSGVKFSDGCDMTASKVKESFDRMEEEGPNGSSKPGAYVPYGTEITADDSASTITFKLADPSYNFLGNLAYPVCAVVDVADTTDWDHGVIGTGPYAVDSYVDVTSYHMVTNSYYRETVPYDAVDILYMGDASAKAMALQSGQVDLVENITNVSDIQTFQGDSNYTVDIASGVRCGFSWMNMSEGSFLSNKTLRQAILMAIDNDTICTSNTIGGLYTAGFSVLPSTLSYGYEKLSNPYAYDPEGAAKLLDDAGIVDTDGDGIRELDGQNIYLRYYSYENRLLNDFSDAHTLYLTQLGIGITPCYGSSDDVWNALVAFDYDLDNNNWTTVGNGDPTEYMANWYSKGEGNYCGYSSPEYDALYEEFMETSDTAARADLLCQMQQILVDDAVVIVDGYYNSSMIYDNSKVGYAHIHTADYYWLSTEIVPAD